MHVNDGWSVFKSVDNCRYIMQVLMEFFRVQVNVCTLWQIVSGTIGIWHHQNNSILFFFVLFYQHINRHSIANKDTSFTHIMIRNCTRAVDFISWWLIHNQTISFDNNTVNSHLRSYVIHQNQTDKENSNTGFITKID